MAKKSARKVVKKKTIMQKCGGMDCGSGGGIYCLGFIGALVYHIANATGFWMGVVGILKAAVWPACVVYELMKFLGM